MTNPLRNGAIHALEINLWAHVGLLEKEQLLGQRFLLDFVIWLDFDEAAKFDDVSKSVDYSKAIIGLQSFALNYKCKTIERFSDRILDFLEDLYGPLPMKVYLRKCSPPINGFTGMVAVEKTRNYSNY